MSILLWYGVEWSEDAIKDFLERFTAEVGILLLTSKLDTDTCSVELSIRKNLFAIFLIGATM